MENIIVNEELVTEFERRSLNPVAELQFKSGVSYGTSFKFFKDKKAPKRKKTMKKIADGFGVEFGDLFKQSSQAAS